MKSYRKPILVSTCVFYTLISFLLLLIYLFLSKDVSHGLQPLAMVMLLPFAFLCSVARFEFRDAPFSLFVRTVIHYALLVGGGFLFLYLPNKSDGNTAAQGFILFLALSILYFLVMIPYLVLKMRTKRMRSDESAYESIYKK